jgi:hypothetical protein
MRKACVQAGEHVYRQERSYFKLKEASNACVQEGEIVLQACMHVKWQKRSYFKLTKELHAGETAADIAFRPCKAWHACEKAGEIVFTLEEALRACVQAGEIIFQACSTLMPKKARNNFKRLAR